MKSKNSEWYKKNPNDKIWWKNSPHKIGEWVFSFDQKIEFNMFRDYPHKLSLTQKRIFDEENPYWACFFKERSENNLIKAEKDN